ncbi:hypothetical protein EYF80_021250 [Liparis tanakae]|uniref:Uncharacterized protein n=1 Tax=Liparis tanakae TaxID=230148 RepID=A0A4Z2HT37_9TELE|nr:hypothetical protein EYF80_021250 [Liparis tanakae]
MQLAPAPVQPSTGPQWSQVPLAVVQWGPHVVQVPMWFRSSCGSGPHVVSWLNSCFQSPVQSSPFLIHASLPAGVEIRLTAVRFDGSLAGSDMAGGAGVLAASCPWHKARGTEDGEQMLRMGRRDLSGIWYTQAGRQSRGRRKR